MRSKFEFIINTIIKVAQTDRVESLERNTLIAIRGEKRGFFFSEKISISITRSVIDPKSAATVTAEINGRSETEDILKEILFDILQRTGMLDKKLEMKLDILFNDKKIVVQDGQVLIKDTPSLSAMAILAFNAHINACFPVLKENIKVEANGDDLVFYLKKGFEDQDFEDFFEVGIKLKSAVKTCRTCGVQKLVFIDQVKNDFFALTVEEMEEMDLR